MTEINVEVEARVAVYDGAASYYGTVMRHTPKRIIVRPSGVGEADTARFRSFHRHNLAQVGNHWTKIVYIGDRDVAIAVARRHVDRLVSQIKNLTANWEREVAASSCHNLATPDQLDTLAGQMEDHIRDLRDRTSQLRAKLGYRA